MVQCLGITAKGVRCKKKVLEGYCVYHKGQAGAPPPKNPPKRNPQQPPHQAYQRPSPGAPPAVSADLPGHIYIYTLSHLVATSPQKTPWLQQVKTRNQKDSWKPFNPKHQVLLKVGYTTQFPVQKRLDQWQSQCGHLLTPVVPETQNYKRVSTLQRMFARLSVTKEHTQKYPSYSRSQKAFECKNAKLVERNVHHALHARYGVGDMLCAGCNDSKKPGAFNIHVEWFLVKRSDVNDVFAVVDRLCR